MIEYLQQNHVITSTQVEVQSSVGHAGLVAETPDTVNCFEFKLAGSGTVEDALKRGCWGNGKLNEYENDWIYLGFSGIAPENGDMVYCI